MFLVNWDIIQYAIFVHRETVDKALSTKSHRASISSKSQAGLLSKRRNIRFLGIRDVCFGPGEGVDNDLSRAIEAAVVRPLGIGC